MGYYFFKQKTTNFRHKGVLMAITLYVFSRIGRQWSHSEIGTRYKGTCCETYLKKNKYCFIVFMLHPTFLRHGILVAQQYEMRIIN